MWDTDTLIRAIQDQRLGREHLVALASVLDGRRPQMDESDLLVNDLHDWGYLPSGGGQ